MKNFLTIIFLLIVSLISVNAQISVVANKSVSESLNAAKVAGIYSLTITKWADGSKIVVFDNSGDAKVGFYTGIGRDLQSLKKEWMKKQLTGEAKAPETLGSDADVIKKVAATSGAIGYVKSSSVTGDVKVIAELK